jgi:hypothetical protein
MTNPALRILIASLVLLKSASALAQSVPERFELGVQVTSATSSQFDATDIGFGGRFSWHPIGPLGLDSEIDFYPRDFPNRGPFSGARVEGLFGATLGPRLGRGRPFAKARAGFLSVREASRPFACILIFPPPLSCQLGAGRTLPAFDLGGGVELFPAQGTFVRLEIGDRLLKYPGLVFDAKGVVRSDSFFSHDFRFAAGAGLRF